MGDTRGEPSMDHILASIKRIINEDGAAALGAARARNQPPPASEPAVDDVLELTEPVAESPPTDAASAEAPVLVSAPAAAASRQSLAALSEVVVRPEPEQGGNPLEAVVRELLRPMLKDWLDAHLPALVEQLVSREIARITGKPV